MLGQGNGVTDFNFIWLFFAHAFGDFAFQSGWMGENKRTNWIALIAHCVVWTACISIALQYLGLFHPWHVLFLILGHAVMDKMKSKHPAVGNYRSYRLMCIDQAFHMIQCVVVYLV